MMEYMHDETERVLHGEAESREYVSSDKLIGDRLHTASDVVVEEIEKIIAANKYPYNADVLRAIETRLGISKQDNNGSLLSGVVYASQCYRDYQKLLAAGFQPFTEELMRQAFGAGAEIEMYSEGIMGSGLRRLRVREIGGKLYAMRPKKRKFHIPPQHQPVRLVVGESKPLTCGKPGGPQLMLLEE